MKTNTPVTALSRIVNAVHIAHAGIRHFLKVGEAVLLANDLLRQEAFYEAIAAHASFDMADVAPDMVAEFMRETRIKMSVNMYYALNPKLTIDGYDDEHDPSAIHLNIWNVNRSPASICNTIIHACVHAVNVYNPQFSFGHGKGNAFTQQNTAPYWIGALAQRILAPEEPFVFMEHDPNPPAAKALFNDPGTVQAFSQSLWLTS